MNEMSIVSNCVLCEQHALHVRDNGNLMQCLNCGYVSTADFIGNKKTNKKFQTLPPDMKKWAKEFNERIWIPSMITLPFAVIFPLDHEGKMQWAIAEMVDVSEEEKQNYPKPEGGFYDKRYDTNNPQIFEEFFDAMILVNQKAKEQSGEQEVKLPKLTKIK